MEKEFHPDHDYFELQNLKKYQICLKLAVDGLTSRAFRASTLYPIQPNGNENNRENILKTSRQRYATRREIVEDKINSGHR